MKKVLRKLTTSVEIQDLSIEKTIFQVLTLKNKAKVKEYLDWLKGEYPDEGDEMGKHWSEVRTKKEWESYSNETSDTTWLTFIRRFTNDKDIVKNIKAKAKEKIKKLFSSDALDNDIKKDLKAQPIDKLSADLIAYKGDEIAYVVELFKEFYLKQLPEYIEESLKKEKPTLTLNNLDKEKWNKLKEKIFTNLYSSWGSTANEEDLENLKKKLDEDIVELNKLMTDARKEIGDNLEKVNNWIKDNISDKTKVEDLPSEADIDNSVELPSSAKQQAKWKLQEKKIELMPETTAEGKIKKHLLRVKFDWERWDYLVKQKDQTDPVDYAMALMFDEGSESNKQGFGKTVVQEMLPKIIAAIAKDTMEDYRDLDKEWGQNLLENGEVKYNEKRDYYGVWKTFQEYLAEEKTNKDKWMKTYLKGFYGEDKFKEVEKQYQELQAQIEAQNNK